MDSYEAEAASPRCLPRPSLRVLCFQILVIVVISRWYRQGFFHAVLIGYADTVSAGRTFEDREGIMDRLLEQPCRTENKILPFRFRRISMDELLDPGDLVETSAPTACVLFELGENHMHDYFHVVFANHSIER